MQIPNHVTNYNIFKDGHRLIGCGNITLMDVKNMEDNFKGAGIFAEIAMPVQAHFQPYSVRIQWLTIDDDAIFATLQQGANLDCWAAMQYHDSSNNKIIHNGWRFIMGTAPKGFNFGKLEVGTKEDAETEYELISLRVLRNDTLMCQIDKENAVCKWFDGIQIQDYALRIRKLIGLT